MKVIMFHSVGLEDTQWIRKHLSVPYAQFEGFCRYLKKKRVSTHFLNDWYDAQPSNKINDNAVVLTFDDGYLDNWVYLFPLLQKYELKATIFVNPGFVDPCLEARRNIEDVWTDRAKLSDLQTLGFLNWKEISNMQESGLVDIQSHSMSHDWLFSSNKVLDLYLGQAKYDWLAWLIEPQSKHLYMADKPSDRISPLGYPIFEHDRALSARKFNPSPDLIEYATSLFNGYELTSLEATDISRLKDDIVSYGSKHGFGSFESVQEQKERYWYELKESKTIIETKLGKSVEFLCWPGGGYNDLSLGLSWEAGYIASTLASRDRNTLPLNLGRKKRIPRISLSHTLRISSRTYSPFAGSFMGLSYQAKQGDWASKWALRSLKAFYWARTKINENKK